MTRGRAVRWAAVLPLYLAVATALGFVDYHVRPHPEDGFTKYSPSVVAGTAEAPGRYRILAPYALEGLRRLTGLPPRENWVAFRWLCLFGALIVGLLDAYGRWLLPEFSYFVLFGPMAILLLFRPRGIFGREG